MPQRQREWQTGRLFLSPTVRPNMTKLQNGGYRLTGTKLSYTGTNKQDEGELRKMRARLGGRKEQLTHPPFLDELPSIPLIALVILFDNFRQGASALALNVLPVCGASLLSSLSANPLGVRLLFTSSLPWLVVALPLVALPPPLPSPLVSQRATSFSCPLAAQPPPLVVSRHHQL
jgi:hypothetical protein